MMIDKKKRKYWGGWNVKVFMSVCRVPNLEKNDDPSQ